MMNEGNIFSSCDYSRLCPRDREKEIEIEMNRLPLHTADAGAEIGDSVHSHEDEIMEGNIFIHRVCLRDRES